MTPVEGLLGAALTVRGAQVHFLLCDGLLPACQMQTFSDLSDRAGRLSEPARLLLCRQCQDRAQKSYGPFGLPIHWLSQWVEAGEREAIRRKARSVPVEEIENFEEGGLTLGEQAHAGALRFFARGNLEGEPLREEMFRRYFEAALLTKTAVERLFEHHHYSACVFHHGIYVPQGVIGDVARQKGVRVVNWNPAYRKRRLIFSHHDTYHRTLMQERTAAWEDIPWNAGLDARLEGYLKSRRNGAEDWISFQHGNGSGPEHWFGSPDFSSEKPAVLLLTNVAWDARLHYAANAFPDMMSWIYETIEYFRWRPELQLLIRVHPAEILGTPRSRQQVAAEIRRLCPVLPSNVFVIGPEERVNTYALAERCDAALIYGTKTGVELAAQGIPVIVAGEAWIRNKGISLDASSKEEYLALLGRLPMGKRLDDAVRERARKYAFHFFFRRMIPVESLIERKGLWPPLRTEVEDLDSLSPGRDPGLDVICDGILSGSDFVYPEEALNR